MTTSTVGYPSNIWAICYPVGIVGCTLLLTGHRWSQDALLCRLNNDQIKANIKFSILTLFHWWPIA